MTTLTKRQKKAFRKDYIGDGGKPETIIAEVRHDDECGNGHNTFSITGTIYTTDRQPGEETVTHKDGRKLWSNCGGCIHDEIAKHFPELAPLIKWHLTSTDQPMHYVANAVYLAGDRDCNGRRKGERYQVKGHEEKRIVFGDFPITFEFKNGFVEFLERCTNEKTTWAQLKPCAVEHPPEKAGSYKFKPKWTISGHGCEWYQCPFDRIEEAQKFLDACKMYPPRVVIFQDKWTNEGEGKERELDAARRVAIWPEATDAELMQEPEQLRAVLVARLPALMAEFKTAVESLGFTY